MYDERVETFIKIIGFHHEPEYDKVFPAQRLSRAEITTKDGKVYKSEACEPDGDNNADVGVKEIVDKIKEINSVYTSEDLLNIMIEKYSIQVMINHLLAFWLSYSYVLLKTIILN